MANPNVATYDPTEVIINFGGNIIDGYAEGTFVEITGGDADGFQRQVGADGEVARRFSADNTHTITITLMQSSLCNNILSSIRDEDKQTRKNIQPLTITDRNGETVVFWPEAWIHGDPPWAYAKEFTDRVWVIDTGQQGSNSKGGIDR